MTDKQMIPVRQACQECKDLVDTIQDSFRHLPHDQLPSGEAALNLSSLTEHLTNALKNAHAYMWANGLLRASNNLSDAKRAFYDYPNGVEYWARLNGDLPVAEDLLRLQRMIADAQEVARKTMREWKK
jgi:hypothetical protein